MGKKPVKAKTKTAHASGKAANATNKAIGNKGTKNPKVEKPNGVELASIFIESHQDIDSFDGPLVLSKDLKNNCKDIRSQLALWKEQLNSEEYNKALETLIHDHILKYMIEDTVCSGFLSYGPSFR